MLITEREFVILHIKMHYFPIDGFTQWNGKVREFDRRRPEYISYKKQQQMIQDLENQII